MARLGTAGRRRTSALIGLLALASLPFVGVGRAVGAVPPPTSSVTEHVNPAQTGEQVGLLAPPLEKKWARTLDGNVQKTLIAGGRVFVVSSGPLDDGTFLRAVDRRTGADLWGPVVLDPIERASSVIAYDAGRVYAHTRNSRVVAFDAATGAIVWDIDDWERPGGTADFRSTGTPITATGGFVYFNLNGVVVALDQLTGAIRWRAFVVGHGSGAVAVAEGSAFVANACGWIYRLNAVTGTEQWHRSALCSGGGGVTPAVHLNRLYVPAGSPHLEAGVILDTATGRGVGTFSSGQTPALSNGRATSSIR